MQNETKEEKNQTGLNTNFQQHIPVRGTLVPVDGEISLPRRY